MDFLTEERSLARDSEYFGADFQTSLSTKKLPGESESNAYSGSIGYSSLPVLLLEL